MSIVIAILIFGVLVLIHEGGHFLAARWCRVRIDKFSIGFGPKLFGFKKGETEYVVSLIPLGGYVKMRGENPDEKSEEEDSFSQKKWYQRAFIAFAGPFANLLFAFILFILSYTLGKTYYDLEPVFEKATGQYANFIHQNDKILEINQKPVRGFTEMFAYIKENQVNEFKISNQEPYGCVIYNRTEKIKISTKADFYNHLVPLSGTIIGDVSSGLPAWKAGLQRLDQILKINGKEIYKWTEVRETIQNLKDTKVNLTIKRNDHVFDRIVQLENNPLEEKQVKIIGITQYLPVMIDENNTFWESVKLGSVTTLSFTAFNYIALFKVFQSPESLKSSIGGPVMVFSMTKETAEKGFSDTINFMAAISILLMIMNLLPIPILDGGHILFCLIEGVFKKEVPLRIQQNLQQVGFLILISLMLFAFYNDFSKMASRSISLRENKKIINSN